jgi:hypothetical protein
MLLGTVLIIGGLFWARQVGHRPGHTRRDFRGPLLMIAAGMLLLGGFVYWLGLW